MTNHNDLHRNNLQRDEIIDTAKLPLYVSIATAAWLLQLSEDTIRRCVADGTFRARRIGKRNLRIETASLLEPGEPVRPETDR